MNRNSRSGKPSRGGNRPQGGGRPSGSGRAGSSGGQRSDSRGGSSGGRGGGARGPRRDDRAPRGAAGEERELSVRDKARWVVGLHSCAETMKARPKAIRELWLRDDFVSSEQLREVEEQARKLRIPLKLKSTGQLDQVGNGHQGVALAVTESPELDWSIFEGETSHIVLILDGLEDPQNLGSILRTAWLTGVSGILIPEDRAVGLTPTVCKIASGGAEYVPVDAHPNLASEMQRLKDLGFWIYGLSEKGEQPPWNFKLPAKIAWVVGSEGSGMRITTERACDELVRIPQVDTGSSYNASIAAAIALSETCRQLGSPA